MKYDVQKYAWVLPVGAGAKQQSSPQYFESHSEEPIWWTIIGFYSDPIAAGFVGVQLSMQAEITGTPKLFVGNPEVPAVGGSWTCFGNRIYVIGTQFAAPFTAITLCAWAIPGTNQLGDDNQRQTVTINQIKNIPPFSCAVAADPANSTIEILDASVAVIQTILLQGQNDFAPIDYRGVAYRCTSGGAVVSFKRKDY